MTTVEEHARPRGRPRGHSGAKEREDEILRTLSAPSVRDRGMTRNELAAALDESESLVYLALTRLRADGRVRKCSGEGPSTVWTTAEGCP